MSDVSKILNASNASTTASLNSQTVGVLAGLPLGVNPAGEIGVKVLDAGSSSGTTIQYSTSLTNTTSTGTIPAGVYGWSVTAISGTVTVDGQTIPVGASVSAGGYGSAVSLSEVNYDASAGNALVIYDAAT